MRIELGNPLSPEARALIAELSAALDKKDLKDSVSNKTLGQDKNDGVIVDQALAFKLEMLWVMIDTIHHAYND